MEDPSLLPEDAHILPPAVQVDDELNDDDTPLQRYNAQLPLSYRSSLDTERKLLIKALHVLTDAIVNAHQSNPHAQHTASTPDAAEQIVSEAYELEFDRDFAALEKGISRYLDLKHPVDASDFPVFTKVLLRGALSPNVDMGLRSKLFRCTSRLLSKRQCNLPDGVDWRPILDAIMAIHIDCVDGGPVIGKDIRDAHCRNIVSLLSKCCNFLTPTDGAEKIWNHFISKLDDDDVDSNFMHILFLSYLLPTRGNAWSGWVPDGLKLWESIESSDWDNIWIALFARIARHQPCVVDWTSYLPHVYSRITASFHLPLGAIAAHSAMERRCPHHFLFLLDNKTVLAAAQFAVFSLSPQRPEALDFLERLFALIANYFHPSNSGRWSGTIGGFMVHLTANLGSRVFAERAATKAGIKDRIWGDNVKKGVAPEEHRLSSEYIERLVKILLPLVQLGLHSKVHMMGMQAASASRDLAILAPELVIDSLLEQATDGLGSISSPHRTSAALKLLAALTPVFLDDDISPKGVEYLPLALQLTLPGIDANDIGKTEYTLRFIAGSAARLQSTIAKNSKAEIAFVLEEYIHLLLERIFALLDSLEAPPKKGRNGTYSTSSQLSYFIFAVAMENLFAALPAHIAISAAQKVTRQLTGSACMNGIKYYGALVRASAAAAAIGSNGSSVDIFIPVLVEQILDGDLSSLEDVALVSIGDEELVWRIRMLAQACRSVGSGLIAYLDKISAIIRLAMDKPERAIYKAGGRLLRGVLEGLTITQMVFGPGEDSSTDSTADGGDYDFKWRIPTAEEWKAAEQLLESFIERAETLSRSSADMSKVTTDRDVLFRVLRLLHAIQRGGRWVFAGVQPDHFAVLDRLVADDAVMSKSDAKLTLKRPIRAGLGGERGKTGREIATNLWKKTYSLISCIIATVVQERPDDGALLYRSLEPIELAHEPFRRGNQSRQTMHASRAYKAAYKPIVASKQDYNAVGGVGREMPRFITKLRVEAHHEMRLTLAARAGIDAPDTAEKLIRQLTQLSINDFPRVRSEARGFLTRTMRVTRPVVRRQEICKVIEVLAESACNAANISASIVEKPVEMDISSDEHDTEDATNNTNGTTKGKKEDIMYEKMMGAAAVLRSASASPLIMRDWHLFTILVKALLDAMLVAERADAASAVGSLFGKLSSLVRPLGIEPIRLVKSDLRTMASHKLSEFEENEREKRLKAYNDLNEYLLGILNRNPHLLNGPETNDLSTGALPDVEKTMEAHWRLQSLVATVLYITMRDDRPPPASVASFFTKGMASDVVTLRQVSSKAVMFILAVHGRKAGSVPVEGTDFDDSASAWLSNGNEALGAVGDVVCSPEFARKLVHTLALDHEDDSDGSGASRGRLNMIGNAGGAIAIMNLSRMVDGDACWMLIGGRPWPSSWIPRSRDSLNLVRIRLYESIVRVFSLNVVYALLPTLQDLIEKLENKQEKIISGVKDEDVRVLAGEVLAGICRGLYTSKCNDTTVVEKLENFSKVLLGEMTGSTGNVNGAILIRLIATSEESTIGADLGQRIMDWVLIEKPLIVPMGDGPVAHLQARRLRYLYSCVADLTMKDTRKISFINDSLSSLTAEVGFDHELKTVREEVARCLSVIAVDVPDECQNLFEDTMNNLAKRLEMSSGLITNSGDDKDSQASAEELKKSRSRQGETLSRLISIIHWTGRAQRFEKYIGTLLPALFASFDESDPERTYHARMALSFTAQGRLTKPIISEILSVVEESTKSPLWKVRASVLAFLQVFSFSSLFVASQDQLKKIRDIVLTLLSDSQLEVRQAAAASFVTMIRDAPAGAVDEVRDHCLAVLRKTTRKGRGSKRPPMDSNTICERHGAVLGLSSMITSSPYTVPKWMPGVLVALSGCAADPPPISTGVRKLFADFMRTHRDEWQSHKLLFTPDELDIVSELLVSPSYYA